MKNSKLETRESKEIRNSKSEYGRSRSKAWEDSESWTWGDEPAAEASLLKEEGQTPPTPPLEDLGERTARFGEAIIRFAKRVPQGPVNNRLIDQLVGAGTSVGANYCEANNSVSGKDFKKSISICRKESKEAMFFLRMCATAEVGLATEARALWREAKELNLIFGAIWRK